VVGEAVRRVLSSFLTPQSQEKAQENAESPVQGSPDSDLEVLALMYDMLGGSTGCTREQHSNIGELVAAPGKPALSANAIKKRFSDFEEKRKGNITSDKETGKGTILWLKKIVVVK